MKERYMLLLLLFPLIALGQELSRPSGNYRPGVRTVSLTDFSRADSVLGLHREIPLTVWYPASGKSGAKKEYVPSGLGKALSESGYAHLDSQALIRLTTLKTHSLLNAAPLRTSRKFPVVFFSAGWGMSTFSYSALIEELVSQGMIVIAMDHLYCGPVRLSDGRTVLQKAYPYETYVPYLQSAAEDARFVMNSLAAGVKELRFLEKMADPDRSGIMGHSIGGNAALLLAQDPGTFRFAINLDGGAFEEALRGTMKIPTLTVRSLPTYTDAELAAKGRTRAGWNEMGAAIDSTFKANLERTRSVAVEVKVPSTGHMSFSDAPFLMPDMLSRFGGTYLSPEETLATTSELILAFIRSAEPVSVREFSGRLEKEGKTSVRVFGR